MNRVFRLIFVLAAIVYGAVPMTSTAARMGAHVDPAHHQGEAGSAVPHIAAAVDCGHAGMAKADSADQDGDGRIKPPSQFATGHCAACLTLAAAFSRPPFARAGRSLEALDTIRALTSTIPLPPERPPRA